MTWLPSTAYPASRREPSRAPNTSRGTIKAELAGANLADREPFQYFDKGSMATVSRFSAVAKIGPLEFSGFIAWLAWLVLHLVYLVGFKTKVSTLLSWTVTFLSTRRGQLTITEQQAFARTRLEQLAVLAAEAHEGETAKAASYAADVALSTLAPIAQASSREVAGAAVITTAGCRSGCWWRKRWRRNRRRRRRRGRSCCPARIRRRCPQCRTGRW